MTATFENALKAIGLELRNERLLLDGDPLPSIRGTIHTVWFVTHPGTDREADDMVYVEAWNDGSWTVRSNSYVSAINEEGNKT